MCQLNLRLDMVKESSHKLLHDPIFATRGIGFPFANSLFAISDLLFTFRDSLLALHHIFQPNVGLSATTTNSFNLSNNFFDNGLRNWVRSVNSLAWRACGDGDHGRRDNERASEKVSFPFRNFGFADGDFVFTGYQSLRSSGGKISPEPMCVVTRRGFDVWVHVRDIGIRVGVGIGVGIAI